MPCRKDYRDLTKDERDLFVAALYHLKSTGVIDTFAELHVDNFGVAHGGSSFAPWHREFLRRFEDELRAYDHSISIPFWNWMEDRATDSLLWSDDFLGQFDSAWTLGRDLGSGTLPTSDMVDTALGVTPFTPFRSELEVTIHNPPHGWVALPSSSGGVMASAASPGDPVFYLHHCFIDMLWAQWQVRFPAEPFEPHADAGGVGGEGLTEAMAPWLTTPEDMLDHRQINGYDYPPGYERDQPLVTLETATVNFNSVPEGETAMRAIVFDLDSCDDVHFHVTSGPTVTSGPAGTAFGVLNADVTGNPEVDPKVRIWLTFTGTSDGDIAAGTVTVQCEETGELFDINITADTVNRPTCAVALVLDQSNSMTFDSGLSSGETRGEVLKFSAPPFVDVIQDDNAIGVCFFDHDAHPGMDITPVAGLGRILANAQIAGYAPNPDGWTSIGEGVAFARDLLDPAVDYDIRAMIVLTDGRENHGDYDRRYITDVEDSIDDRVYAIGLGTAENIQPSALIQLCDGNEGYLLLTGALNDDAYFRLAKYYLQILAGVTNNEVVLDPDGWIQPGQKHRIPFSLNEGDITANVVLLTPAPFAMLYALETPDGEVITPATAGAVPALAFGGGSAVAYYRTTLPIPTSSGSAHAGKWHALLQVNSKLHTRYLATLDNNHQLHNQTVARGIRYSLSAHAYSTLRMHARVHQSSFEPGAELTLRAQLSEYGRPISHRATVRAELVRPDDSMTTLTLSEEDPGVFEAAVAAAATGVYRFRVMAEGSTMRGRPFTREQLLTGVVWHGGDQPPPSRHNDPNRGHDRLCRFIDCLMKHKGLVESLERKGVDIGALLRCVRTFCAKRPPEVTRKANSLEARLAVVMRDPQMLQRIVQVLRESDDDGCSD